MRSLKLADPAVTTEPRGLTETQSIPADIFTTAAVPGRSAALDECVASKNAAGVSGISNCKRESPNLRAQGIVCRPLVWAADGRPHPAVPRTLQYAADIASSRNGQQRSAKSLQHRWKHQVQITFFRRRAVMTRAVLPEASARAEWLLAGFIDRVASRWTRAHPLGGGDDDEDADAGSDTTVPDDDNDDLASFASQQTTAIQTSNL